ncbi:30S ribosomal protein S9 [Candidatus Azambacteria bacterium]|nr:30S ribosomal protein S9 [Candidatus Azambacteria bacterium]
MTEHTKKTIEKPIEDEVVVIKSDRYYEAVGRRKAATARARLYTKGTSGITVNGKELKEYFALPVLSDLAEAPLKKMKSLEKFKISVKVSGGGIRGQAEAVRHAISRALIVFNADFKKRLKRSGFLKRDPRAKERKKYGLKKARKSPRWSKR